MLDFRGLIEGALAALDGGRPAEAEKKIRTALGMSPRDDQLLHLLGVSLIRQSREDEAIEPLRKAISLNRRDAEYHNALGCALRNSGMLAEGLESFERALKLDPALQDTHYNLGLTYQRMGEFDRAEERFRFLLERDPRDVEVTVGLANLHWFMGDFERALQDLRGGIAAHPASGDLRFLLGEQLLALGRFEEGWRSYLWRVNRHMFLRKLGLPFESPVLMQALPESLEGATVRVHAEQGIGDDLFFLRFVAQLRDRGARVVGAVTPRLVGMVERSGILDECIATAERVPPSAEWRMLGDLPYLLKSHARPVPEPLRFPALASKVEEAATTLRGLPRPLIGLTWRAGTGPEAGNRNAFFKEVPFAEFARFAAGLPGTLLVLQRQPKPGEVEELQAACGNRVLDLSGGNADLEGMLALLTQLDEYVAVSNTNVHLCAALGRSVRVLVARSAEFRWMAAGAESPWFSGMPVYRQDDRGDWRPALGKISAELSA